MRMQFTSIQGPEMSVIFAARWTNEVRLVTGWQGGIFSPPIPNVSDQWMAADICNFKQFFANGYHTGMC